MNNLEFLSYQPTPTEKYLGIATIRIEKKYIYRFKINQNPKGEGFFANPPQVKIGENYYPGFQFDSSYEGDEIKKFVLSNVKLALQQSQPSAFTPTPMTYSPAPPPAQVQFNFEQPPF